MYGHKLASKKSSYTCLCCEFKTRFININKTNDSHLFGDRLWKKAKVQWNIIELVFQKYI